MNNKAGWWDRVIHGAQHTVFRLFSVVFSSVSTVAIYWFFGGFGTDPVRHNTALALAIAFAGTGYFVTRGLAHRLMNKQRIRAYAFVTFLYMFVEVVCNFGYAASDFPGFAWVQQLQGWEREGFSALVPLVLSIVPLFNIALAWIDVDLMLEKGVRLVSNTASSVSAARSGVGANSTASPSRVQPKNAQQPFTPTAPAQQAQATLPPNPPPVPTNQGQQAQSGGAPNNLKNTWDLRKQFATLAQSISGN